jgi:hypothetical protein
MPPASVKRLVADPMGDHSAEGAKDPFSSWVSVSVVWTPQESRKVPPGWAFCKRAKASRISQVTFVRMS